jgi:hypothetical protein
MNDVTVGIQDCEKQLSLLGASRSTPVERRKYLNRVSRDFTRLAEAAISGHYTDSFFGDAMTDSGVVKRFRAVVEQHYEEFTAGMRTHGKARRIIEDGEELPENVDNFDYVYRTEYVEEVNDLRRKNKGRELNGTFNPLVIGDLFHQQCQPSHGLARDVQDCILKDAHSLIEIILSETTAPETRAAIRGVIDKGMEAIAERIDKETTNILKPHLGGIPQTYNRYLTDTVQKMQRDRREAKLRALVTERFGRLDKDGQVYTKPSTVLDLLKDEDVINMEDFASLMAIDYSEAYFKVSFSPRGWIAGYERQKHAHLSAASFRDFCRQRGTACHRAISHGGHPNFA